MLVRKTQERLASLTGPPELLKLVRSETAVRVNGRQLEPLSKLWPAVERAVAQLEESARGAIIHGDLCFSNILYDLRSRIVKPTARCAAALAAFSTSVSEPSSAQP